MSRTDDILAFLKETEKLKLVYRQIWLSDTSRRESDAEHSWHLALFLLLFEKELEGTVDMHHALRMALIHDIVEVESGDVGAFDEKGREGKAERELLAAKKLFGSLPKDIGDEFLALFLEFEERETPEAKIVQAFDKLHPTYMNVLSGGKAWKQHGITYKQVRDYKDPLMEYPLLKELNERILREAKEKGFLN